MSKATRTPWQRSGCTVYALTEDGRQNRFSAHVQDAHTSASDLEDVASLIAAAPDLYDIAQLVIGSLPSNDPLMREIRRRAEAAVAKAEGRS